MTFTAIDTYLDVIKVDSTEISHINGQYTITADNQKHTVSATDKAGNVTIFEFNVYKIYTVTYIVDGNEYKKLPVNHGEDAVLPMIPAKEGYDKVAPYWQGDHKAVTSDIILTAVYTINPGDYIDVTPNTNMVGSKLDNTNEELKQAIPLTQEELELVKSGEDVEVWLVVKDISTSVSVEEKTLILNKVPDHTVGIYLDASLFS